MDGTAAGPSVNGLEVSSERVEIEGVTVRGFGGHGILSWADTVTLRRVNSERNCGWGIFAEGHARLEGRSSAPARLAENGHGTGCLGGGIFASKSREGQSVRLVNVALTGNNGPGALVTGGLSGGWVTATGNAGAGIALETSAEAAIDQAIDLLYGENTLSNNAAYGVHAMAGHLRVSTPAAVTVENNGGWGLFVENGTVGLDHAYLRAAPQSIRGNGTSAACPVWFVEDGRPAVQTRDCSGGGIFASGVGTTRGTNVLTQVDVSDNHGPGVLLGGCLRAAHESSSSVVTKTTIADNAGRGILARAPVQLRDFVAVSGNGGQGVAVIDDAGTVGGHDIAFSATGPGNRIENNLGDGLQLEVGRVELTGELSCSGNAGWGGHVRVGSFLATGAASVGGRAVQDNGFGPTCRTWDLPADGAELFTVTEAACAGGGLWLEAGNPTGVGLDLRGNNAEGALVDGNVSLTGGAACLNGGEEVSATGTVDLDGVDQACL
ncbi:MAG: hypothetical protein JXB32_16360 [Deltaproteobacteria bacterium]|nr:hypothetical protein [Deltaproteobacteria bacterium]